MPTKVTVQDIADALGLSRTTVSKVLNHSPAVTEATRTLVLNKAKEMNYRTLTPPAAPAAAPELSCFALVMHAIPGGIHMGTAVISSLDQKLRQAGYSLITCAVTDAEYAQMTLPPILSTSQIKAIVCMELFHPEYSKLLSSLGKPILFIDACIGFREMELDANLLLMDNRNSTRQMLTTLIRHHGIGTMGFLGDAKHCLSFRERYEAFLLASVECGVDTSCSVLDPDPNYADMAWLHQRLSSMERLPRLFFCANDFLAIRVMHVLEAMGKRVPEDVMVCGFDGIASIDPALSRLTTIVTPADQIGSHAATVLLHKLNFESEVNVSSYLNTRVLFRDSAPVI